jgi:hypothetical protein
MEALCRWLQEDGMELVIITFTFPMLELLASRERQATEVIDIAEQVL